MKKTPFSGIILNTRKGENMEEIIVYENAFDKKHLLDLLEGVSMNKEDIQASKEERIRLFLVKDHHLFLKVCGKMLHSSYQKRQIFHLYIHSLTILQSKNNNHL